MRRLLRVSSSGVVVDSLLGLPPAVPVGQRNAFSIFLSDAFPPRLALLVCSYFWCNEPLRVDSFPPFVSSLCVCGLDTQSYLGRHQLVVCVGIRGSLCPHVEKSKRVSLHFLLTQMCSIWLVWPRGDFHVYLWMPLYANIVPSIIMWCCVHSSVNFSPLSVLLPSPCHPFVGPNY